MEHTVNGISFRTSGLSAPIAGGRRANGCELLTAAAWSDVRALAGTDVPGLGVVLDVGAPRIDPVPVGARISLVTAAQG